MKKRVLKGERLVKDWMLGFSILIPFASFFLIYCDWLFYGVIGLILFVLLMLSRKRVVLDYNNNEIVFHSGVLFSKERIDASQYGNSIIKTLRVTHRNSAKVGSPSYSILKLALNVVNSNDNESRLIKIGVMDELEVIAEELETHFGIIRVN